MEERRRLRQEPGERTGAVVLDLISRLPPRIDSTAPWLTRQWPRLRLPLLGLLVLLLGIALGVVGSPYVRIPAGERAAAEVLGVLTSGQGLAVRRQEGGPRLRLRGPSRAGLGPRLRAELGLSRALEAAIEVDAGVFELPESVAVLDYAGFASAGVSPLSLQRAEYWLFEQAALPESMPPLTHALAVMLAMRGTAAELASAQGLLTTLLSSAGGGDGVLTDLAVVLSLQRRYLESALLLHRGLLANPNDTVLLYDLLQVLPLLKAEGQLEEWVHSTGLPLDEERLMYRFLMREPARAWRREVEQRYAARMLSDRLKATDWQKVLESAESGNVEWLKRAGLLENLSP